MRKLKFDEAEMMEKAGFAVVVERNHTDGRTGT